ncbi:MAG: tRNA (adenosine(37)-N6)-threonylcarbamoyltransferase complex ATPase subunit type 1 TsaE [Propionivibrio sp.]
MSDEAATNAFGQALAPLLAPGMVVWLDGDLGAGKTTLVRAVLRAFGHAGPVKSPTYTLVEVYVVSSIYLYHFDFYRFNQAEEFEDAGLGEYFREDTLCLVEWPEKAAGHVPEPDLELAFRFAADGREGADVGRILELHARTEAGLRCIKAIKSCRSLGGN